MKKLFALCFLFLGTLYVNAEVPNVTVGAIYNLTGAQASIDNPALNGFNLAFDQVLRSPDPLLNQLKKIVIDGKTDPVVILQEAVRAYQMKDLIALIGIDDDDMARSVSREARKAQKPFISSGATSPLLIEDYPLYTFLVAFGDNAQAAAVAEYATETLHFKTCFVLYNLDMQYARLIAKFFLESFPKNGGTVVEIENFTDKTVDLSEQIKKIKEHNPDMIYLAGGPYLINTLLEKIREAGITTPIFGGDGYDTPLLSNQLTGIYYSCHVLLDHHSHDPAVVNFMKEYLEKYGSDPTSSFAALGYDACNLFASALVQAQSSQPDALVKSLNQIKFKGVTGEISYVDGNHVPRKPVTIVSLNNGKKVEVARFIPKNVPPAK